MVLLRIIESPITFLATITIDILLNTTLSITIPFISPTWYISKTLFPDVSIAYKTVDRSSFEEATKRSKSSISATLELTLECVPTIVLLTNTDEFKVFRVKDPTW